MPTSTRINERYEKREILGQGGMGVVWWAYDHSLKRDVSLKTIRDVRDKTALDLFRKECATLAGMAHPNIVEIYDVGATEENGQNVPYFVMPLLRGSTLDELIASGSSRLSVERGIDILLQVCRGLQAAHDHGLVHRDLKPSNIFVLQDDSVKIIDFGVAHLVDVHSTVKHAGTLLYMSPEQIMLKKPTPASDLFSLGVVAFEVMTRRRPFEATNREDLAQRILSEIPPPAYQVNSTINLPVSQVIHKAMAKQPYQRFSSAKEFAENLQKAGRNEPIESFSSARIEPRIQRVKKALETGELEFASEIISELESEAMLHTELATLRKAVDEAVRSRTIQQLLETARRRFEEEEYQLALQKVQEILNLDSANTEAHTLRGDIENKRSSRQIEDWLRLARQHMENHAYEHARQALQSALKMRPKETNAQQLLSEVDRREQEYHKVRQEKENVYNAALESLDKGDLSSALSRLERVLEMDRRAPDTFSPDRAAVYQKLYNKVRSEHDQLTNSYQEAKKELENGNFATALGICDEVLQRSPSNALFQSLKFDIEDRQRQEVSAFVARMDREVDAEHDLNRKIQLLEEALTRYPEESHFQRSLHTIRSKRDLVESIVSKARAFEEKGQFAEALAQWEILRNIYRQYPGLEVECERVNRRKQHKNRADIKGKWVQQIDQALNLGDFARALEICGQALADYQGDAELLTLERAAKQGLQRLENAQALLNQAGDAISSGDRAGGLELLREANRLDPTNASLRQRLLGVLLDDAKALIESNWLQANEFLQEALDLDPGNPLARSLKTLVQDKKQEFGITEALSKARTLQASGDLNQAISLLDEALALFPQESRLTQLRSQLRRNLKDQERASDRKKDMEEFRSIQKDADTIFDKDGLASLFARTQALATRYGDDEEVHRLADKLKHRINVAQQSAVAPVTSDIPTKEPVPRPENRPGTPDRTVPPRIGFSQLRKHGQQWLRSIAASMAKPLAVIQHFWRRQLPATRFLVTFFLVASGFFLLFKVVLITWPQDTTTTTTNTNPPPKEKEPPPPLPPPVDPTRVQLDRLPSVQVMAELDGAEVLLDGVPLENKGRGLYAMDKISEGEQTLEVVGPDGSKATLRVRMKKEAIPEIEDLKAQGVHLFAVAAFKGAAKFFGSSPAGNVRLGFEEGGATEEIAPQGLLKEGLGTGPKVVFVQYGPDRRQHQLELGDGPSLFLATAPDAPNGTLEISAGSSDVQVFINGRQRRFVPYKDKLYMGLIPGLLRVRVERAGYSPEEQTVDLKRDKPAKLTFHLRPIPTVATLIVRNAAGAEVALDGQAARRGDSDNVLTLQVSPGRHKVLITRQGFRPISQDMEFTAGVPNEIDVSKLSFEAIIANGNITFQGNPATAEITVSTADGRNLPAQVGIATPYREGKYSLRAKAAGFDDYSEAFEVKAGESKIVAFEMKKTAAAASPAPAPAMSGWNNAVEWKLGEDGYYVKKDDRQSVYRTSSGTFSFTTPCTPKKLTNLFSRGDCTVRLFLTGSASGELRFEITDSKIKRQGDGRPEATKSFPKIAEQMTILVRVTPERATVSVNGKLADSVDGDYTKGRFGINSVSMLKDFRYSPN